jgi:hypothetical protein
VPDLSGMPILDVALGLSFLFFVLSIVASAVYEAIAAGFALRAKNLERAILGLLGPKLKVELYKNWRIRALFKKPDDETSTGPSYISPRLFAEALVDIVEGQKGDLASLGNARVQAQLKAIFDFDDAKHRLNAAEQLFNHRMERASGWYKRKAQLVLWLIALAMAFGANINSFHIGSQLWKDDALRAAVVAQAQAALDEPAPGDTRRSCPAGQVPDEKSDEAGACKPDPEALSAVATSVDDVKQLDLPIGWVEAHRPTWGWGILGWIFGCLVTAAAVSLGAPFWFSALQKIADLRGAGARPKATGATPAAPPAVTPTPGGDEEPT